MSLGLGAAVMAIDSDVPPLNTETAARLPRLANKAGVKTVPGFARRTRRVMSTSVPGSAAGRGRVACIAEGALDSALCPSDGTSFGQEMCPADGRTVAYPDPLSAVAES
jgi:hypothetical protein